MSNIVGVYEIINKVNSKVYIGQTIDFNKRKSRHISSLRLGKHCNKHLQHAYDKYGEDAFEINLITECEISELDEIETNEILSRNATSRKYGYNLMHGGQYRRQFTEEVRKSISEKMKGRKYSEEHLKNLSKSLRNREFKIEWILKGVETRKRRNSLSGEKNGAAVITNKQAEGIINMLIKRIPVNEIKDKYNVSQDVVYNLLYNKSYTHIMPEVRDELASMGSKLKEQKYQKAIEAFNEGKSQNQIAKELNISRNTLRRLLKDSGINTRLHINQYSKVNTEVSD